MVDEKPVILKTGKVKGTSRPGKRQYLAEVDEPLEKLWVLFDQMWGKRLVQVLQEFRIQVAECLHIPPQILPLLATMSTATIDRHLSAIRRWEPLKVALYDQARGGA